MLSREYKETWFPMLASRSILINYFNSALTLAHLHSSAICLTGTWIEPW